MSELSQEKLNRIHTVLLEMMIEFDRICRKHNIEYMLDGGTLLGAVRNGGFIPWDDDGDLMMTRDNYERFFEACQTDLDKDRFFLQDYRTDPYYRWGYSKLRRNGTSGVLAGHEKEKWHNGIFIDIMILDNVPDGYFARKLFRIQCFLIRKGQYSQVGYKSMSNPLILRGVFRLMALIPRNFWFRRLTHIYKKNNRKPTELVMHMTFPIPGKKDIGYPAEWFNTYTDIMFEEEYTFRIISDYDTYLRFLYGNDYMTPPPVDKREHYEYVILDFGDNS